jgi:hypothetical protein
MYPNISSFVTFIIVLEHALEYTCNWLVETIEHHSLLVSSPRLVKTKPIMPLTTRNTHKVERNQVEANETMFLIVRAQTILALLTSS